MILDRLSSWRSLFPKWSFFSEVGQPVTLEIRKAGQDWQQGFVIPQKRKIWHLFFNPEVNLYLWKISRLQDLQQDPSNQAAQNRIADFAREQLAGPFEYRLVSRGEEILRASYES